MIRRRIWKTDFVARKADTEGSLAMIRTGDDHAMVRDVARFE